MQVLFDFEQIEVARGPQGTLEGAPNLGGTIHLKRRKPTGSFDLDLRTSFGENNLKEFDVAINFPITQSIAGKVTQTAKRNGGDYINNVTVDRRENEEDRSASAIALLATFGDNLTAHYIYDTEDDDSDTPALLNISTSSDQLCMVVSTGQRNT
jgi:iron complex outermembrane receptor protein|tara:strand:+ start:175 stop:636 length:462 start_codon:yes stop_codon:yes gene_type:complete